MSVSQLSPVGHENVHELDGGGGRGAPAEHLLLPAPEDAARRAAHKEPGVQYAFPDGARASGSVCASAKFLLETRANISSSESKLESVS